MADNERWSRSLENLVPGTSWQDLTVYTLLRRSARSWPEGEAMVTPRERWTYAEMLARVDRLANTISRSRSDRESRIDRTCSFSS